MRRISSSTWAFIQAFVWTPIATLIAVACFDWVATFSGVGQAAFFLAWLYVMMAPAIYALWILPVLDARDAAEAAEGKKLKSTESEK